MANQDSTLPTITVIIAVFNRVRTLERAICSVLEQNYSNVELIVIDGGSTDGSVDVIKRYDKKILFWLSEKDRGIYDAWNKGVRNSKGDWLYFLGADDRLATSSTLSEVARHLAAAKARIVYGQVQLVSPGGEKLELWGTPWESAKRGFFVTNTIPHQGVFHHRSLFDQFGLFSHELRIAGDYEFLLRELKDAPAGAEFLPELVVTEMEIGGVSSDIHARIRALKEMAKARKLNGVPPFPPKLAWLYAKTYGRILVERTLGEELSHRITDGYRKLTGRAPIWTVK